MSIGTVLHKYITIVECILLNSSLAYTIAIIPLLMYMYTQHEVATIILSPNVYTRKVETPVQHNN